jgi:chromosome segregation ATPase
MALPLRSSSKQPQPDGGNPPAVANIRNRQDHIEFLENYITELTTKIDELTGGRDLMKEIESMEFRIEVLAEAGDKYGERLAECKSQLKELQAMYNKVEPEFEKLIDERSYYRHVQSKL